MNMNEEEETTIQKPDKDSNNQQDNEKNIGIGIDASEFSQAVLSNEDISEDLIDSSIEDNRSKETEEIWNHRALHNRARTYELENFEKNAMIIFNHEHIQGYKKRHGTANDVTALRETFYQFGFEITTHKDLNKDQLFKKMKSFSKTNFTEYGCVVVVILTHGGEGGQMLASDRQAYSEMDVVNQFKSWNKPTLVTKPVILLIQACRGESSTVGVPVLKQPQVNVDQEDKLDVSYYLPVEADLLIVHSSFAGKPSYRVPFANMLDPEGSWFIQSLCRQVNSLYLTHDFESILTEVKREIAIDKYDMRLNQRTNEMVVNKQVPAVTSTLMRKLFLRKYLDSAPSLPPAMTICQSMDDLAPNTSGVQTDSCLCFFDQFSYMQRCLRHFLQENPGDSVGEGILNIASLESGVSPDRVKATLITINNYLQKSCKNKNYYKYIHFVKDGNGIASDYSEEVENVNNRDNIFQQISKACIILFLIFFMWQYYCSMSGSILLPKDGSLI